MYILYIIIVYIIVLFDLFIFILKSRVLSRLTALALFVHPEHGAAVAGLEILEFPARRHRHGVPGRESHGWSPELRSQRDEAP